eukprot:63125-Ditylum_brightwellii.AAC.1
MRPQTFKVDSDLFIIGVDGHAMRTISNNPDHSITSIQQVKKGVKQPRVKNFGGDFTNIKGFGTVQWRLEDDDGKICFIKIKGAVYVPEASYCILAPQHWSQQTMDNRPRPNGTWCTTLADCAVLQWDQRRHTKTVPYDPRTN